MLNKAREKNRGQNGINTKRQKKITLTEIWPCGGEGEEMALKDSSLFPNI